MPVIQHTSKPIASRPVAEGTGAWYWEKPAGFAFVAGQLGKLTLVNPPETDAEGKARAFCFSTAPGDDKIDVATRLRETSYKHVLKGRKSGESIVLDGPSADVRLHNKAARDRMPGRRHRHNYHP